MAISSYPTPADAGLLCLILVKTAMSISIVKNLFLSILHAVGIRIPSWEEEEEEVSVDHSHSSECQTSPSESYMDDFRTQFPAITYESISVRGCPPTTQECSICLSEFEQNAEVNRLSCGHVFHRLCLEEWLNYWNTTCPLCRNHMMPQEAEQEACPM